MSGFEEHVESIVARVRATEGRKDLMREELLAHLAEVYREEAVRGGAGRAAAERAIGRLGEPGELVESLQASVPRIERVLWAPIWFSASIDAWDRAMQRRAGETAVRHATRTVGWFMPMIATAIGLVVATVAATRGKPVDVPVVVSFAATALVSIGLGAFFSPLLCAAMARLLREEPGGGRRSAGPVWLAAMSSLAVMMMLVADVLIIERGSGHGLLFPRAYWPLILVLGLAAPLAIVAAAISTNARHRRSQGWEIPGSQF